MKERWSNASVALHWLEAARSAGCSPGRALAATIGRWPTGSPREAR
jgi:hypothetical protein